jgi:hypothetical protein
MKSRAWMSFACLLSCGVPCLRADAADDVRTAFRDFLQQRSYSWRVPRESSDPTRPVIGIPGQHEKGGFTKLDFFTGPHIPRGQPPLTEPQPGYTDDDGISSDRWVFATASGWQKLNELPAPAPQVAPPSAGGGTTTMRTSYRALTTRRPDHEVKLMQLHITDVEVVKPGVYHVSLSADVGLAMLLPPGSPAVGGPRPTVHDAAANAEVYLKDGALQGYTLSYSATVILTTARHLPIAAKTVRELFDVGTTVIDVPAEVKTKLGH